MDAFDPPTTIGKYRVDGILGHGAMGTVALGYDPDVDRQVALKTIHAHLLDTEQMDEYLRRFRQEARAAARASHPNIVTVYEAGVANGMPYLAMEYVPGSSLKTCLAHRGRFRPEDAAAILLQVLEALDHAHAHGVIHRDIKPANVLVLPNGHAKLTDFGVARMDSWHTTHVGALLGTPAYCAPEQRAGRELTPRADLYAVGVVLLELVTGQRPDPGDPTAALAGLRRGEPVAFASRFRKVLERGLAVDPQRRFATAAAMSEALRHSLDDRTIIELISGLEPCRTPPPLADGPASAPASSHPAGTAHPSDTALSALAVDVIEAKLAERIGPLARVLMRRHAAEAADKTDLVQRLAGHIRDSAARDGFLADLRQAVAVTPATGSGWPMTGMDAAGLDTPPPGAPPASARADSMGSGRVHKPVSQARAAQLEAHLAEHLGPVAKLLMRRALQKEPSEPELLEALCRHIRDPDAQAAFMAAARMG